MKAHSILGFLLVGKIIAAPNKLAQRRGSIDVIDDPLSLRRIDSLEERFPPQEFVQRPSGPSLNGAGHKRFVDDNQPSDLSRQVGNHQDGEQLEDERPKLVKRPSGPSRGDGHKRFVDDEQLSDPSRQVGDHQYGEQLEDEPPKLVKRPSGPSDGAGHKRFVDDEH